MSEIFNYFRNTYYAVCSCFTARPVSAIHANIPDDLIPKRSLYMIIIDTQVLNTPVHTLIPSLNPHLYISWVMMYPTSRCRGIVQR